MPIPPVKTLVEAMADMYAGSLAADDGFGDCECEPPDAPDARPYVCEACYLRTAYNRENSDA